MNMISLNSDGDENRNIAVFDADVENLSAVVDFVNNLLEKENCPPKAVMQLSLAVEEIFVNIASYAYETTGPVKVIFNKADDCAVITFEDRGRKYNPLINEDPDITLSAEDRQVGGLGIYLVKKNVDEASYTYRDGKNILILKKKIS